MPRAIGIDHIAIRVSDMEACKRFFVEVLGLIPCGDFGDEFFMEAGDQKIALFQGDRDVQSIDHLALNVNDFDGLKRKLEGAGYKVYKRDMVDGPDGVRVQLVK